MGFWPFSRSAAKKAATINPNLLEMLACPLSKEPLRFCSKSGELINDSLGVAYKVVDGVPHLNPLEGRIIDDQQNNSPPVQ